MSSAAKQGTSAVTIATLPSFFIVSSIRAPWPSSPESTTSIGNERQAGKNGWFTKQRSGCLVSAAILALGMPEVAKPIRQSARTTSSRSRRIARLVDRSSVAASST
jgi:hypothetical protein